MNEKWHVPVLRNGKSGSYLAIGGGAWGILYGCELDIPLAGSDSPDELLTTPLLKKTKICSIYCRYRTTTKYCFINSFTNSDMATIVMLHHLRQHFVFCSSENSTRNKNHIIQLSSLWCFHKENEFPANSPAAFVWPPSWHWRWSWFPCDAKLPHVHVARAAAVLQLRRRCAGHAIPGIRHLKAPQTIDNV